MGRGGSASAVESVSVRRGSRTPRRVRSRPARSQTTDVPPTPGPAVLADPTSSPLTSLSPYNTEKIPRTSKSASKSVSDHPSRISTTLRHKSSPKTTGKTSARAAPKPTPNNILTPGLQARSSQTPAPNLSNAQKSPKKTTKRNPSTNELQALSHRIFSPDLRPPRRLNQPSPPSLAASSLPPPCAELDERPRARIRRFKLWRDQVPSLLKVVLAPKYKLHLKRYQMLPLSTSIVPLPSLGNRVQVFPRPPRPPLPPSPLQEPAVVGPTPKPWAGMTKLQLKAERRAARLRLRQYRWALDGEYERRFRGVMRGFVAGIIRFEKDNIKDGKSFLDTTPTGLVQRYTTSFRNLRKSSSAAFSPEILDLAKIPNGSAFRMPVRARDAVRRGVKNEDERLRRKKEAKAARLARQAQLRQANGPPPPYTVSEAAQVGIQEIEDTREEEQEEDEDEDEGTDDELKTPTTSNIHTGTTITSLLPKGKPEIEREDDSLKPLTPILAVQSSPRPTYPPVQRQSSTPILSTPVSQPERDEVAIRDEIVLKIMDNMRRLDLLRAELRDSVSSADTSAVEQETETMKKMLVNVLRRHGDTTSSRIAEEEEEEEGVDEHGSQGDEVKVKLGSGSGLEVEVEVQSQSVPTSLVARVGSLNIDDDTRLFALSKNRSDPSQISNEEEEEGEGAAQEADSDTSSSTISSAYESNESSIDTVNGHEARQVLARRRGTWGDASGGSDSDSDMATAR